MSAEEREYMKKVDDKILNASKKTLEKLQQLDQQTQLNETTFYDAYSKFRRPSKKPKASSKASAFPKSKRS